MPDRHRSPSGHPSLTLGQAAFLWMALSVVFVLAGGLGVGVTALLYEAIVGDPFGDLLYAVIFGGFGLIAYRTARTYAEAHLPRSREGDR